MPINLLEYAKIMQNKLDQQAVNLATSGWMEANAGQVIYNGGDEVKIPTISTDGLADYDRDKGYAQGSITSKYNTYKLTQDRGRRFHIDAMDVDETGFVVNAANVIKEFQTRHVVSEIDAYRYAQIAKIAEGAGRVDEYTPDAKTIISKLRGDIRAIQDIVGDIPIIISMTSLTLSVLENSTEWQRIVNVADFKQGDISFKVKTLDGNPIKIVPSKRFYSDIVIKKDNGFENAGVPINWILTPQSVPIAINKTDVLRIFDPLTNQDANAWKIDYRKYHDIWILESRKEQIFVSKSKVAEPAGK